MNISRICRYADFLHERFGRPVRKVSVDAGFGCPNRDGLNGHGGCAYCTPESFTPPTANPSLSITGQLQAGIERGRARYPDAGWIAYFQPRTNTYASVETLERVYAEALAVDGVIGLAIGTRPDCLPEPVLDLLRDIAATTYLQLEIGLQTTNDETLRKINRGHDTATFVDAVKRARGLTLGAHIILGLPGDTAADACRSADLLAGLGIDLVKIHNFHLVRGTRLAEAHAREPLEMLSLDAYAAQVVDVLRRLPRRIAIERLWGHAPDAMLIGPDWSSDGNAIWRAIEQEMEQLDARQGDQASASAIAFDNSIK